MTSLSFEDRIAPQELAIVMEHITEVPVKIGALARALGLEVVVSPLPLNISGSIEPRGDTFVIRVNRYEPKPRQRFTIAHEIAHYLIHRDRISGGLVDSVLYRSKLSSRLETEANKLAADIIMPKAAMSSLRNEFDNVDATELASFMSEKFNVSRQAAEIRIG